MLKTPPVRENAGNTSGVVQKHTSWQRVGGPGCVHSEICRKTESNGFSVLGMQCCLAGWTQNASVGWYWAEPYIQDKVTYVLFGGASPSGIISFSQDLTLLELSLCCISSCSLGREVVAVILESHPGCSGTSPTKISYIFSAIEISY